MWPSNCCLLLLVTISIFLSIFSANAKATKLPFQKQDFVSLLSLEFPRPVLNYPINGVDDILPKFVGDVSFGNEAMTWKASCFQENEARLDFHNNSGSEYGGGTLHVKVSEAHWYEPMCSDLYVFATPFTVKADYFFRHGEHTIEFSQWEGKDEYEYVKARGVSVFLMHSGWVNTIQALLEVETLFKNSEEGEKANVNFLENHMGAKFLERPHPWVTPNMNVDDIKSGDFLALSKIRGQSGGFETLEKWVTGSYAGHSAVCLRNPDGKLFVAESGRSDNQGKDVVDIIPWEQWWDFEQTEDDGNPHIALLPLHPDIRAKFNESAAWEYAISMKGNPYGYHNMIFSWIDTPLMNYPHPVNSHLVSAVMTIWNMMQPAYASNLWNEALNKRLGTQGLDIEGILVEIASRNMSFAELLTYSEMDSWEYSDGKSVSCVAYVMQIYKAAGVFHPHTDTIQGTEFTVKDGYQVKIYEDNPSRLPKWCNNEKEQTFCQIRGKYQMELPGHNTIEPYPYMNEKCPSLPPLYERPEYC